MITIIIIINIGFWVLVCVCRVIFRANPIDSGLRNGFSNYMYITNTAKFAHMNGHWKAYDIFARIRAIGSI